MTRFAPGITRFYQSATPPTVTGKIAEPRAGNEAGPSKRRVARRSGKVGAAFCQSSRPAGKRGLFAADGSAAAAAAAAASRLFPRLCLQRQAGPVETGWGRVWRAEGWRCSFGRYSLPLTVLAEVITPVPTAVWADLMHSAFHHWINNEL